VGAYKKFLSTHNLPHTSPLLV